MINRYSEGVYDAVVIGAGHAGCEAALALARTGMNTALLTLNLDSIAFMACNPSIGGTAKGHLVRELDALGGEMGVIADKTTLQIKMLNRGKDAVYYRLKKGDCHIIKRLFRHAERDLDKKSKIDANFSGTTCVMVLQIGDRILCSNIGDSRAIMVKTGNVVVPLSIDQKPNDPEESKRIVQNGGEISQYEEDGEKSGPYRVWKKGEVYPGIAMSRSVGDFVATSLGVIPEPKFIEEKIDNDCKFIVIASDGVWEFLENERVAEIVMPFYNNDDPDGACKALIKESTDWWNKEDIVVDDITVVVVFF